MATKAKTVTARIAVVHNDKGEYQAGGYRIAKFNRSDDELIDDAYDNACGGRSCYSHTCIVDIELPIPKPLVGTVRKVKAVKT